MTQLLLSLLPLALGVVMSPLAIMALVAVLLSARSRQNGIAYLIGWAFAIVLVLAVSWIVFGLLGISALHEAPTWVAVVRLVIGAFLVGAAVLVYRRGGRAKTLMAVASTPQEVVEAAPQLPGWLNAVQTFSPGRSALLGLGIFVLNPVDATCAILASLDIRTAEVSTTDGIVVAIVFAVIGIAPILIPVVIVLIRGKAAQPFLDVTRAWIAGHSNVLNAALLLVIAVLQLQKGVSALVG
jgi:ABC-type transport system involved in multi-copper enzyme maturation permease subunit